MIQSFRVNLPPDGNGHVFLVFDTVQAGRHVFTACGLGRIDAGQPLLSPIAQTTLHALTAYAESQQFGSIHFAEIATVAAAPIRVRKALERANQKDVLFFLCRSPQVYDAAFAALNVSLDPQGGLQ